MCILFSLVKDELAQRTEILFSALGVAEGAAHAVTPKAFVALDTEQNCWRSNYCLLGRCITAPDGRISTYRSLGDILVSSIL